MPKHFYWCPSCRSGSSTRGSADAPRPRLSCRGISSRPHEEAEMEWLGIWPEGLEKMRERQAEARNQPREAP